MSLRKFMIGAAFLTLGACASDAVVNPSQSQSTDPMLKSILTSFRSGCVANAPAMNTAKIRAGFEANPPRIASNMLFLATGTEGRTCSVLVRNYGTARPAPSYGDMNALARYLQSRVGGSLQLKTEGKSATVRTRGTKYTLAGSVNQGDLHLVLFY